MVARHALAHLLLASCGFALVPGATRSATLVRLTADAAGSSTPATARGSDGLCRVVWTDTRTGSSEIFFAVVDSFGNRLTPDRQVSHSPSVSSTVPRVDVDDQGNAYVCWLEYKTVWLAKLDPNGNTLDSAAVSLGFNYLAEYPDLSVTPHNGLGVAFTSQSGVQDEDYIVLFDSDLNQICKRRTYTNLTWLDRHVTVSCDDQLDCTMYWQASSLWDAENLTGAMASPTCGDYGSGYICSGNNFGPMSNHAVGLVVQRANRIYLGSGGGCPVVFSEAPGPSVNPSAAVLDANRSIVAWEDRRAGTADIYYAVYTNSTRAKTGVDTALATGSSASQVPSVTSDGRGDAFFVWQDDRDGNSEIYFARTPELAASTGVLTGSVCDAVTLQPITYAQVLLQGPDRPPLPARTYYAGGDGTFRIGGLAPGRYGLQATSAGHTSLPQYGIELAAGGSSVVNLCVSTGVALTGRVVDAHGGLPVRGAHLVLTAVSGPSFSRTFDTGPDGRYRFDLLPGTFDLSARVAVSGTPTDYFSTVHDYYLPRTLPSIVVAGDRVLDVSLTSNTVVLLHGIRETGEAFGKVNNLSTTDSLLRVRIEAAGFHTEAPTRDWHRSMPEQGATIARWFADRPFRTAGVIGHSMGGLAARWYVEQIQPEGALNTVPLLVTLGTPHHGSPVAKDLNRILIGYDAVREALQALPFRGGASLADWETGLRGLWPCLVDLEPGSANLNLLNYGSRNVYDDPPRALCLVGGPTHSPEILASHTRYVTLAGESPNNIWRKLEVVEGLFCPTDGAVPAHSARLWASGTENLLTRCLATDGNGGDCSVGHIPALEFSAWTVTGGASDPVYVSSQCVAANVVDILHGLTPQPTCGPSGSETMPLESPGDTLFSQIPETDHVLAPRDSSFDAITMPAGASLGAVIRWQRGGARVEFRGPGGARVDSAATVNDPSRLYDSDATAKWMILEVRGAVAGAWTVVVHTDADSAQHISVRPYASGNATLDVAVKPSVAAVGQTVTLLASVQNAGAPVTGANATVQRVGPDGTFNLELHDDGLGGDQLAGDGTYTATLVPAFGGSYSLQFASSGGSGPAYLPLAERGGLRCANAPDLQIGSLDITAAQTWAYLEDPLVFSVRVRNVGTGSADSTWFLVSDDSTGVVFADTMVSVPAGGSSTLGVTFHSPDIGLHALRFTAIDAGSEPEPDLSNNTTVLCVGIADFGAPGPAAVPPASEPRGPDAHIAVRAVPQPARSAVTVQFQLPRAVANAQLSLVDISGRRLRKVDTGPLPAGWNRWQWTFSEPGTATPPGVYFFHVVAGGVTGSGPIVIVH